MIQSILYFFIITFGLGLGLTYFLKLNFRDTFEYLIMNIGIGLGVFVVLATLIGLLHIPLDYRIFFVLALIGPIIEVINKIK